jgi:hypothetical protein
VRNWSGGATQVLYNVPLHYATSLPTRLAPLSAPSCRESVQRAINNTDNKIFRIPLRIKRFCCYYLFPTSYFLLFLNCPILKCMKVNLLALEELFLCRRKPRPVSCVRVITSFALPCNIFIFAPLSYFVGLFFSLLRNIIPFVMD